MTVGKPSKPGKRKSKEAPASVENWQVHDTRGMTADQIAALALSENIKVREKPKKAVKAKDEKPAKAASAAKDEKPATGQRGRPSDYCPATADEIITRLSNGEPLRQICRDDHMPHWTTVYDWKDAHEAFSLRFSRARELGHDAIAEDTIEMIDEPPERTATEHGDKVDPGYVQWQKNRVEQRLKLLAKWNPKKYGDKIDMNHGGQENNPVQVATKVVIVPQKQAAVVETKPLAKPET